MCVQMDRAFEGCKKSGLSFSSAPVARGDPSKSIPCLPAKWGAGWSGQRRELCILQRQHGPNASGRSTSQTSSTTGPGVLLCSPSPWHSTTAQPHIQHPQPRPNSPAASVQRAAPASMHAPQQVHLASHKL